jgi:very-short-patch-repair endonuclease
LNANLTISFDGPRRPGGPAACRRDRRKDHLLQENGCLALRFLTEDVAKDLDAVLDAILRVLANRRALIPLNPPGAA